MMGRPLLSRRIAVAGLALILAVNVGAAFHVLHNRHGDLDSRITLSQRELRLPPELLTSERSVRAGGLTLKIEWSYLQRLGPNPDKQLQYLDVERLSADSARIPSWLDRNKLEELGYRFPPPAPLDEVRRNRPSDLAKMVFLALEFDGPDYQQAISRAEHDLALVKSALEAKPDDAQLKSMLPQMEGQLRNLRDRGSRLFAIDAAVDGEALRARHPDRAKVLILKAKVRPMFGAGPDKLAAVWGRIEDLPVAGVNVPLHIRRTFQPHDTIVPGVRKGPLFAADLVVGADFEPWIVGVESTGF